MRRLKHLPLKDWPEADRIGFAKAYERGDVFDETNGPGGLPLRRLAQNGSYELSALAWVSRPILSR